MVVVSLSWLAERRFPNAGAGVTRVPSAGARAYASKCLALKNWLGTLPASNTPRELVEARRVVQHGKTADAALLDEFLELTRMIGRSTAKKSPDAADVIDNERHTREFFYPTMNGRRAVSTPPQGLRPLVLAP